GSCHPEPGEGPLADSRLPSIMSIRWPFAPITEFDRL
ncbi:MAG: hypothetical protein ACI8UO_006570, partial [Verrucomicrobiales bacterium]